ncbi:MAG: hypothetical protein V3V15_08675 [Sphingorhabdus sp.]
MARSVISHTHFRGTKAPPIGARHMRQTSTKDTLPNKKLLREQSVMLSLCGQGNSDGNMGLADIDNLLVSAIPLTGEEADAATSKLVIKTKAPAKTAKKRKPVAKRPAAKKKKAAAKRRPAKKPKAVAKKKAKTKKPAAKKVAKRKTAVRARKSPATKKPAAKRSTKLRQQKANAGLHISDIKRTANGDDPPSQAGEQPDMCAPLPRNAAVQLYRPNGVFGQIGYWLRQSARGILGVSPKRLRKSASGKRKIKAHEMLAELNRLAAENRALQAKLFKLTEGA